MVDSKPHRQDMLVEMVVESAGLVEHLREPILEVAEEEACSTLVFSTTSTTYFSPFHLGWWLESSFKSLSPSLYSCSEDINEEPPVVRCHEQTE